MHGVSPRSCFIRPTPPLFYFKSKKDLCFPPTVRKKTLNRKPGGGGLVFGRREENPGIFLVFRHVFFFLGIDGYGSGERGGGEEDNDGKKI